MTSAKRATLALLAVILGSVGFGYAFQSFLVAVADPTATAMEAAVAFVGMGLAAAIAWAGLSVLIRD